MSHQIKGGFYEEIQKSFFEIGIDSKTLEKMKSQHGKQLLRKRVKKELIEKYNNIIQP